MTDKIDDGGPAFPQWAVADTYSGWNGEVVQVVKETDQNVMILQKSWDGTWSTKPTRRAKHNMLATVASEADAVALVLQLRDLYDRRMQTERQYAEKRKALVEAARAKGGAK